LIVVAVRLGWDLLTMRRVFTAAGFISAGVALAPVMVSMLCSPGFKALLQGLGVVSQVHQLRGYNPPGSCSL